MLPYCTDGETISAEGYPEEAVTGRYYVVDQGTLINADISSPVIMYLTEDGRVTGEELSGSWSMEQGSCYMNITLGETDYSGIFCEQNDEAGTPVMVFSAVGDNTSLWGVRYD